MELTLEKLEPGWTEELSTRDRKSSARMQGSLRMQLERLSRLPESSRRYSIGDPPNLIDWRVYARSDELIMRQQRDDASSLVEIVLDGSDTMEWPSAQEIPGKPTKFDLGFRIAMWLAHTHLSLGDHAQLRLFINANTSCEWSPRSPSEVLDAFSYVSDAYPNKSENLPELVKTIFKVQGEPMNAAIRRDIVWFISDLLSEEFVQLLLKSKGSSHRRFSVLHTLSSGETDLSWMEDETCYIDRSGKRKDFLGKQLRQSPLYLTRITEWQKNFSQNIRSQGGTYFDVTDKTPLREFFHFFQKESLLAP